jgi:DNA primase
MSYAQWVDRHCQVKEKLANDEWLILCPFHDNKQTPSCCINVRKGLYVCYSCGAKGPINVLADKIGEPITQVFDLKSTKAHVRKVKDAMQTHDEEVGHHDDEWLDQYRTSKDLYHQWAKRGINKKTVDSMSLGYAPFVTEKWGRMMSLCIPIRDLNDNVLGIIRRVVGDDLPPGQRYFYPYGFKISWHLFNASFAAMNEDHPLVITEGSIDALLMHQAGYPAVAILGSALHNHQRTILRTMPHDDITLMLDFDKVGQSSTMTIAPDLVADGFNVRLAQPPLPNERQMRHTGRPKDAGDMTLVQRHESINTSVSYLRLRMTQVVT